MKRTEQTPLTPADLAHILACVGRQAADLRAQCDRRKRHATRTRHAVAALMFVLCCAVYIPLQTAAAGPYYATTGVANGNELCNTIFTILS